MNPRCCFFAVLVLLIAQPVLAHNPSGAGAIAAYLFLSPLVMLATIGVSIILLKRNTRTPLRGLEIAVISVLMILASLCAMIPAFFVLAIASQVFYSSASIFFLYLVIHVVAALIVPVAFYYVRKFKEREAIGGHTS